MTRDETRQLLTMRRSLTGETWNEDTIDAWQMAFPTQALDDLTAGLIAAAIERGRVTVHDLNEHRPKTTASAPAVDDNDQRIALDEYIARLRRRADAGSIEAKRELAAWTRHVPRLRDAT